MGELKRFEDTLVSVLENRPEQSEVVVVSSGPYDDPYQLRGEVQFVETPPGADLLDCFVRGAAASTGPVVHMLAAGFEATPGWADAALARFDEPRVAAVAPLVVDRGQPERILSAGLRWTAAGAIGRIAAGKRRDRFIANDRVLCGPELATAFYRRDVLETVETLQDDGSELATAMDFALAMHQAGHRVVQEPRSVTTATRELFVSGGAWREGVASERLFRRWAAVPGGKCSWAAHLGLMALEGVQFPLRPSILARLGGRCWAALGFGSRRVVAISPVSRQEDAVIRPHFGVADTRPPIQSRAAG